MGRKKHVHRKPTRSQKKATFIEAPWSFPQHNIPSFIPAAQIPAPPSDMRPPPLALGPTVVLALVAGYVWWHLPAEIGGGVSLFALIGSLFCFYKNRNSEGETGGFCSHCSCSIRFSGNHLEHPAVPIAPTAEVPVKAPPSP